MKRNLHRGRIPTPPKKRKKKSTGKSKETQTTVSDQPRNTKMQEIFILAGVTQFFSNLGTHWGRKTGAERTATDREGSAVPDSVEADGRLLAVELEDQTIPMSRQMRGFLRRFRKRENEGSDGSTLDCSKYAESSSFGFQTSEKSQGKIVTRKKYKQKRKLEFPFLGRSISPPHNDILTQSHDSFNKKPRNISSKLSFSFLITTIFHGEISNGYVN